MGVTGAIMLAGALSALIGAAVFAATGGESGLKFLDGSLQAIGLGVLFGTVVGAPLALLVALVEGPRAVTTWSTGTFGQMPGDAPTYPPAHTSVQPPSHINQ
jgi:hypothetical protein